MFPKDICVIDFETEMTADRFDVPFAVELGVVRLRKEDLMITDTYQSLIKPEVPKIEMAQRAVDDKGDPLDATLGDILREDLDFAPQWFEVMPILDEFASGCMMAAWPVTFERPVLDRAIVKHGLQNNAHFGRRWLDIGSLCYGLLAAKGIFAEEGNAPNIASFLGVPVSTPKPHRGLPDALFESELLKAAMAMISDQPYYPPRCWERNDGTPTTEPWAGLPIPADATVGGADQG